MNASRRARPTARIARLFIVEALGLGWTLGLALCTAVLFTLYELGLPVPVATGAALLCTVVVLGFGLRGLGLTRRADDRTALLEPQACENSLARKSPGGAGVSRPQMTPDLPRANELSRLIVPIGLGLSLVQVVL